MHRWSFTIEPPRYRDCPPVAGAPADLGYNDLQHDAVRAALALIDGDEDYAGGTVVLFKTTKSRGTVRDQTWFIHHKDAYEGTGPLVLSR